VASAHSEIKGIWFVTARRLLSERFPRELEAVVSAMPREHRSAMADPLASRWYPEEALQASMGAVNRLIARGDKDRMTELLEDCTVIGVNHFFRIALRLTTTTFALRMIPVAWDHLRRGPGGVKVGIEGRTAHVEYETFPYFDDVNYRLLVLGTLRPLLRLSTGKAPDVEIERYSKDSLRAIVRFSA
jgi:hypothetical protein